MSVPGRRPQTASNVQKWFAVLCYVMGAFCFCCCACFAVFLGIAGVSVVGRCFAVAWWCAILERGGLKECDYQSLNENSNTASTSTCQKSSNSPGRKQRLQHKQVPLPSIYFLPEMHLSQKTAHYPLGAVQTSAWMRKPPTSSCSKTLYKQTWEID